MPDIFTIGHSTRSIEELIALLTENGVECLADVRTIPRSRTNPQFNKEAMPEPLQQAGIAYIHMPKLGGLRSKRDPRSHNTGWKNSSFRNYADYAETQEFQTALDELERLASASSTAYMCSEAVWWKCHRRIITDYMLLRKWTVRHIMGTGKSDNASMTPMALILGPRLIQYPGEQHELPL